jgi:GT2 family glycosyltransferase
MVSIVIPTGGSRRAVRGHELNLVVNCVQSILSRSTYTELEIVCVTDSTVDQPTRSALVEADPDRVHLLDFDGTFHFARKVNRGALAASGDVLLFLNDDTEVVTPGWIEAMLVYALDPDVGAVGARLLFENGCIQHAGVVGVRGNPGHPYHGLPADTPGHGANALVPADFLAVTGACLMTRRHCFAEAGGMSAWFPASYNDLDYCLKLDRLGYRVVATPDAVLEHFESSSRSGAVASRELELIRRRWGRLLRDDPFYSPGFPSGTADFEAAVSTP